MKKRIVAMMACAALMTGTLAGCAGGGAESSEESSDGGVVELTALVESVDMTDAGLLAVIEKAEEELGIKVNMEVRVAGSEGDNIIKTRLASGEMTDILIYNSGALFKSLNPEEYFIDISGEDFCDSINDDFKSVVGVDDQIFGVPFQSASAYGVMYNKSMYEEYGLEIPKTWDEFMANCDVLKENGETAILATYADNWTAQLPFLGDAYNLYQAEPDFPEKYDAGEAKWATSPAGLRGFEKLADTAAYYNDDYLAATYDDGSDIMLNDGAGHWIIQSKVLLNMYNLYEDMDLVNNLGMFPVPSDDPEISGFTLTCPKGIYGNKSSENQEAILKFMEFYISEEGLDTYFGSSLPVGPALVNDYTIPEDGFAATADIQSYADEGKTALALEFISPVKGADCAAICQELASGQTTALEAAEKYDKDCEKQAIQLGLDW